MKRTLLLVFYMGTMAGCLVIGGENTTRFSTLTNQAAIRKQVLKDYKKSLRPIFDQDVPLEVGISFAFNRIHDFDVVNGIFAFTGGIRLTWADYSFQWNQEDFGNATTTRLLASVVWIPNIGVKNPAESEEFMESDILGFSVLVTYNGGVKLENSGLIKIVCEPDVTYYPFDVHQCSLFLTVLNYNSGEISLRLKTLPTTSSAFENNGQWNVSILRTYMEDTTMQIRLQIERRSSFLVVNIFLPVLFIISLNVVVFLLPVESGERISFSITGFLSFAVFITILTDKVPHQSNPLSILSSVLAYQLANSTMILICNILVINLYHRSTEIRPICLLAFVKLFSRKSKKTSSSTITINSKVSPEEESQKPCYDEEDKVTWKDVAGAFDKVFLLTFLCSTVIPIFVFIVYVKYHIY